MYRLINLGLMFLVGPYILFTFPLVFQADSYQYWGDKYHSVLSSQYLFSQFRDAPFIQPLWRDDVLSGNLWFVSLPTVPFMLDNVAARLFHLSPFGIDLIGNLAGYAVAVLGMYVYLRRALLVSPESATAGSLLFACSGYILAVWTGWPHAYVITGLLPFLLAMAHKLDTTIQSGHAGRILVSWVWLALLFYLTAAVDSFRTFPIMLSLVGAYTFTIFGLGRCTALVLMAMAIGVILYAPWLWLLWDAARISQRMVPGFVQSASFGLGHLANESVVLLKRMATGFNVYAVSAPAVLLVLLAVARHREFREEPIAVKKILWFAGLAFAGCFGMDAFASQINALKKDVLYINGFDVVRFEFFAAFFGLTAITWLLDRLLLGANAIRMSQGPIQRVSWPIAITGILFAAQGVHLTQRLHQLPDRIYPQDVILYVYLVLYAAVTLLFLLLVGLRGARSRNLDKSGHAGSVYVTVIVLSALFQSSVIGYRFGLDSFRRGAGDEPVMTCAERFAIPDDVALVKQYNISDSRVVDLTRPYRALSTAGITVLPLAGLRTPEGYNFLFPRWYHQFVATGINGMQASPTRWVQIRADAGTNFEALKLLDVRYVLAPAGARIPGYTRVVTDKTGQKALHEADVAPAFLSPRVYCAASESEALDMIHAGTYKTLVSRAILISSDPGAEKLCRGGNALRREAEGSAPGLRVHRGPDTVKLEVESLDGGILTLADTYYPGWHAFVDGKESPLLRTYTALRGVAVGPGRHSVTFVFSPEMFWVLLRLSYGLLAVLAVALGLVALLGYWKWRGSTRPVEEAGSHHA